MEDLHPNYVENEELFQPWGGLSSRTEYYSYRPGLTDQSPRAPFILGPEHVTKRVVGYTDGTVEEIAEPLPPDVLAEFEQGPKPPKPGSRGPHESSCF